MLSVQSDEGHGPHRRGNERKAAAARDLSFYRYILYIYIYVVVVHNIANLKCKRNFIDEKNDASPSNIALRGLSSKVLYALSQSHFGAVFNRIASRLQELSASPDDNSSDYNDIDLIQHVDLDVHRLTKLLQGL